MVRAIRGGAGARDLLATYKAKRDFAKTPEPKAKVKRASGNSFVIQKHEARRTHFDFRLEHDGVLKSWAVTRGPSLDPGQKRLAVMTEDHPLEYGGFEGVIPKGEYGAGPVMIWDEGTWEPIGDPDEGLAKGDLKFKLHGKRLNGDFVLVRMKPRKEDRGRQNWLLIKKRDEWASEKDVTADNRSVRSERVLNGSVKTPRQRARSESPMPTDVRPMLSTLVEEPFDRDGWLFEIKWDGYRAIAEIRPEGLRLYSRNLLSFEQQFVPIVNSLKKIAHEVILDGEIVVTDEAGKPSFQLLQEYQKAGKGQLVYYVFDLLYLDGQELPLTVKLAAAVSASPIVNAMAAVAASSLMVWLLNPLMVGSLFLLGLIYAVNVRLMLVPPAMQQGFVAATNALVGPTMRLKESVNTSAGITPAEPPVGAVTTRWPRAFSSEPASA
jgi:bifunctional non-homologous end joining protein LigD